MNVICPKCKESYSIKSDLFLDKKQQLQCIRCGHNWEESFFKEAVEKEEKFENLLSKKGERKLTSKQVLKILKEEAEFDKKFKRYR
ncbi:MAG: zinc-ribbon domain-containing protein [Paracoccaceae bacterium]